MIGLAERLEAISELGFTIYADDITLWTASRPIDEQQEILQAAFDVIDDYLPQTGMRPSPEKTTYVVIRGSTQHEAARAGKTLQRTEKSVRVLGIPIDRTGTADAWLADLRRTWHNTFHLIKRICFRMGGAGTDVCRKLVSALLTSRAIYGARCYDLLARHWTQLQVLHRSALRVITGLPKHTRVEELHRYAKLPTLRATIEASKAGHEERLKHTRQGRTLLAYMGKDISTLPQLPSDISPWDDIAVVDTTPTPRNMGAQHTRRRAAFAARHVQTLADAPPSHEQVYTDAAFDPRTNEGAVAYHVVGSCETHSTFTTADADDPTELELRAIVWALDRVSSTTQAKHIDIYTDSQYALHACKSRHTSSSEVLLVKQAFRCAEAHGVTATLHWIPGHQGIEGNERAHDAARALLSNRVVSRDPSEALTTGTSTTTNGAPYEPDRALRAAANRRKRELRASVPSDPDPLPAGLPRSGQVLLHRLRSGFVLTPDVLERWRQYRPRRERRPPSPSPNSLPSQEPGHPTASADQEALQTPQRCPECDMATRPSAAHLFWECQRHAQQRDHHLRAVRVSSYEEWIRPATGSMDSDRAILDSLLAFAKDAQLLGRL
ncbi:uncharacterized protein [Dermacentor albipictus]|uniref:uncharacterized protein n=1 Tax=Dermacentor albipictus TaxID=60249 RepID=UPI0038FCCBC3